MEIKDTEQANLRAEYELNRFKYGTYGVEKPKTLKKGDIIAVSGNWENVDDGEYEILEVYDDELPPRCSMKLIKATE